MQVQLETKVEGAIFSDDSNMLLIISADNRVRLIDIATKAELMQVQLEASYEGVAFCPESKIFSIQSADNKVCLFDSTTQRELLQIQLETTVAGAGFRDDGKIFFVKYTSGGIRSWDITTGQELPGRAEFVLYLSDEEFEVEEKEKTNNELPQKKRTNSGELSREDLIPKKRHLGT